MARGNIGDKDFNVQFNDTLLSSKAFINPRYEGCKNTAPVVDNNSFQLTSGNTAERDGLLSSFPKLGAPVEHYTNVIFRFDYIGGADYELKNWSNVSTVRAYEIYDSEEKDLTSIPLNTNIPFYVRTYTPVDYQDYDRRLKTAFKVGNKCKILLSDKGVTNSLRDQYTVHFNKGNAPGNSYLIWGNKINGNNTAYNLTPGFIQNDSIGFDEANYYNLVTLPNYNNQVSYGVSGSDANFNEFLTSIYFTTNSGFWSGLNNPLSGSGYKLTSDNSEIEVYDPDTFFTNIIDFNSDQFEFYINFNSVKENFEVSSSITEPPLVNTVGLPVKDTFRLKSLNTTNQIITGSIGGSVRSGSRLGHFVIDGEFNNYYSNYPNNNNQYPGFDGRIYRVTLSNRFLVIDLDRDLELPSGAGTNGGWIIPQTLEPTLLSNLSNIIKEIETNLE